MSEFLFDRRDLDFVLFEQLKIQELNKYEKHAETTQEDVEQIIDAGLQICGKVLYPNRAKADAVGCRVVDGQVHTPESYKDSYQQYAEGGWIGFTQNAEMGGMGQSFPLGLAMIEMATAADCSFMFYPGLTVSAAHVIETYGAEALKEIVVPKMLEGEWTGTMCLTEPNAGTDVGSLLSTAKSINGSEDEFWIQGTKIFISAGDHDLTENIIHLVLARVEGDPEGIKGISLFVVPKHRFDTKGNLTGEFNDVKTVGIEHKMGIQASATCQLAFGEDNQCKGYLIGERTKGIVAMFQMMNEARMAVALQGSALANASYQSALAYAKERIQSSKVQDKDGTPVAIIEHPDVRRNLMLCKAYSEGLRAFVLQMGHYEELAQVETDETKKEKYKDLVELLTPICKAFSTDVGFEVTEYAVQILGGAGYCTEYGVEQYMRDCKIGSIYEGTNGVQALDLLGRKMRLKGGGLFMNWMQETNASIEPRKSHATLGWLAESVDKAKNALGEVAFNFQPQMAKDIDLALLGATPFLEMFGFVELGRIWLDQACLAQEKLDSLLGSRGTEGLNALLETSSDARFYFNKVKTAEFYGKRILPKALAVRKEILSDDRSPLEVLF